MLRLLQLRLWPLVWLSVAALCNLTLLKKSFYTMFTSESQTYIRVANQRHPSHRNKLARRENRDRSG